MQVSARLQLEPAVARNLSGYLITAFHHRVRWECLCQPDLAHFDTLIWPTLSC